MSNDDDSKEKLRRAKIREYRKNVGDITRIAILSTIARNGGMLTNQEIATTVEKSVACVRKHLAIMYREGLISYQYVGGIIDPVTKNPICVRVLTLTEVKKKDAIPKSKKRGKGNDPEGSGTPKAGT